MDSNADLVQLKVLIDPFLIELLEGERKINPHIFYSDPKISFMILFFETLRDAFS
jgi:hypothetical protein